MNTPTWFKITTEQYALADPTTGEILAKVTFKEFWRYNYTQYLTLEQAKAAAEKAITAAKIKREEENLPWNA